MLVVCLLALTKSRSGFIGVSRCSLENWSILLIFVIVSAAISRNSIKTLKHEQSLKMRANGGELGSWDVKLEGNTLIIVFFSLCGGFIAGAFGLGGSIIF